MPPPVPSWPQAASHESGKPLPTRKDVGARKDPHFAYLASSSDHTLQQKEYLEPKEQSMRQKGGLGSRASEHLGKQGTEPCPVPSLCLE